MNRPDHVKPRVGVGGSPICHVTGQEMRRGVRPMTITYKGLTATFDMPGWYADGSEEGLFVGPDNRVWDRELAKLKAQAEGLLA